MFGNSRWSGLLLTNLQPPLVIGEWNRLFEFHTNTWLDFGM
jgi:hypothetical protein